MGITNNKFAVIARQPLQFLNIGGSWLVYHSLDLAQISCHPISIYNVTKIADSSLTKFTFLMVRIELMMLKDCQQAGQVTLMKLLRKTIH